MNKYLKYISLLIVTLVLLIQSPGMSIASTHPFDFETGNAGVEVIIPAVAPVIFRTVSPTGGDAPLVLRFTTLITNAWFDAVAPYHPTAKGVYSDLGRRPAGERTNTNLNIAMLYSGYRVLLSLSPAFEGTWRQMLESVGLNPDDASTDLTSPIGIGNAAGNAVVLARENDGMNQLGNEKGCQYNCQPYADYTGYRPVNTAYELMNPSRWQPDIVSNGTGTFEVQHFITPQLGRTEPYSYKNPNKFRAPFPEASQVQNWDLYKAQADDVLAVSANLTDQQKMKAELFDNKIESLGFSVLHAYFSQGLSLMEFVQLDFVTNVAAFDTAIAIWNQKYRYDAVRPFSAIEHIYGDSDVTAWGGPGNGTVTDMPATEWRSYLQTANHPEYPSASASFCAAHAQAARSFLGTDDLNWTITRDQGQSRIEPGVTPQTDINLVFETWTDFAHDCGMSRLWGGVHFYPSIPAGQDMGRQIGGLAYQFVQSHIDGTSN